MPSKKTDPLLPFKPIINGWVTGCQGYARHVSGSGPTRLVIEGVPMCHYTKESLSSKRVMVVPEDWYEENRKRIDKLIGLVQRTSATDSLRLLDLAQHPECPPVIAEVLAEIVSAMNPMSEEEGPF